MNLRCLLLSLLVTPVLFACAASTDSSTPGSSTTVTDAFTTAAITKTWNSSCAAGSEPIIGGTHTKTTLTLGANGAFSYVVYWYVGSACNPPADVTYQGYGTYALSGYNTGSTTNKTLTFTFDFVNYSTYVQSSGNTIRSAYNTDCGGTSPYTAGANATDGASQQTKTMVCAHENFPNTGARSTFSNVATFSGNSLTLGASADPNIPGSFTSSSVPATATVPFN